MGCDIHMYVEYKRKENQETWSSFGGRLNTGRNYYMFGLLCSGVRSDDNSGIDAKGLPDIDTMGYESRNDARLYIKEDAGDEENACTLEQAESWIKYGGLKLYYYNDKPQWVDHPDWHSHSWLTLAEYEQQLNKYYEHPDAAKYPEPKYNAVLAILKSFEKDGFDTRIVFWFDN